MLLYFLPFMFAFSLFLYLRQRPQLNKSFLLEGEEIKFIQGKTTVVRIDRDKDPLQMGWACIKITQKRIFFLYPDKRAISKILDFSGDKKIVYDRKMMQHVLYLERAAIKVEENKNGQNLFCAKAIDRNGALIEFRFFVKDVTKLREVLGI
jgi:hypothetical protein